MEGSHSGRVRRLGKAVSGKPDQEFESPTLRIIHWYNHPMTSRDTFLFALTFITGLATGVYLYTMSFRPTYVPDEGLVGNESSAQEFSVVGKEYGGFRMEGYVPASFRVTKDGSYTYIPGGIDDEALNEQTGTLPRTLRNNLVAEIEKANLEALAEPAEKEFCEQYVDGIDHTYRVVIEEEFYELDTCRTALPYDHTLTETLDAVWTYLREGSVEVDERSDLERDGLGGYILEIIRDRMDDGTPDEEPVACTMEAKMCPDGSAVGRSGPNCEFAACPGE